MADLRYQAQAQTRARTGTGEIDKGLRSYMLGVYNYMALGIAGTAILTLFIASNPAMMQFAISMRWVFFIGILGMGFVAPKMIFSANPALGHAAFWLYCALWGFGIAPMVGIYLGIDPGMVFRAFLITSVTFGAVSVAGYVTKRDLSAFGTFFMMASIGLVVAMIVNAIFVQSIGMSLVVSCLVVLLFAGVTAYETQSIKQMYYAGDQASTRRSKSIFGAFLLYGSFITLFIHILSILGIMGRD